MTTIHKQKKKSYLWLFFFSVLFFIVMSFLYVPITDAVFGVPFDAKKKVSKVETNGFYVELEIPCNRFYKREVGFRIEPPIRIQSISEAQSAVTGKVYMSVSQHNEIMKISADLSNSGWSANAEGVWSKVISRYPPIGSFFCGSQKIIIDVKHINLNLDGHTITAYVSRDRRP